MMTMAGEGSELDLLETTNPVDVWPTDILELQPVSPLFDGDVTFGLSQGVVDCIDLDFKDSWDNRMINGIMTDVPEQVEIMHGGQSEIHTEPELSPAESPTTPTFPSMKTQVLHTVPLAVTSDAEISCQFIQTQIKPSSNVVLSILHPKLEIRGNVKISKRCDLSQGKEGTRQITNDRFGFNQMVRTTTNGDFKIKEEPNDIVPDPITEVEVITFNKTCDSYNVKIRRDRRRGSGHKKFVCGVCQKSFYPQYALSRHERVHSGGTVPCPCPFSYCTATYKFQATLTKHLKAVHPNSVKPI